MSSGAHHRILNELCVKHLGEELDCSGGQLDKVERVLEVQTMLLAKLYAKKKTKPTDELTRRAREQVRSTYKNCFIVAYSVEPKLSLKEHSAIASLVDSVGPDIAPRLVRFYFYITEQNQSEFWYQMKNRRPISALCSSAGRILFQSKMDEHNNRIERKKALAEREQHKLKQGELL